MEMNLFRIKSLMAKEWDERKKHYLLILLVYFGVMAIVFVWTSLMYAQDAVREGAQPFSAVRYTGNVWDTATVMYPFYLMFLFLAVASRGSDFMSGITDRQGLQACLSLPASVGEKFLVRWLFTVPFTYLIFFVAFFAADLLRILVCMSVYPDLQDSGMLIGKALDGGLLVQSLAVQSLFLLGSTFWKKNGFIKTAAILVACVVLWLAIYITIARQYEDVETVVVHPGWIQSASNTWLPLLVAVVAYLLSYWRFRSMQLAYAKVRRSTKVVVGLLVLTLLSGGVYAFYAQKYCRYPNDYVFYVNDVTWYPLPVFKHLVLEDSLEVYSAGWVSEVNAKDSADVRIHRQPLRGVLLDLNLSVAPVVSDSSVAEGKQGIRLPTRLYPYFKTELRHDTLHLFFDYPAREKMRYEGREYLKAMRLYSGGIEIRTGSLLSVRNRMHTVVQLSQWDVDTLALEGTSFELKDSRVEALSIKSDSTWITARFIGGQNSDLPETDNRAWNALILNNSTVDRLHEYQNAPAYWYLNDDVSRVDRVLLHGVSAGSPVVATKQSALDSKIMDASWKTEFGYPVKPFWIR